WLAFTAKNRKLRLFPLAGFLAVLLAAGIVWAVKDTSLVSPSSGLYRITHLSINDITTQSRLLTWKAAYEGWKDRWLSGYGYENFNIAFNRYFPATIFRDNGSQIWFDRAHNIVFDTLVQSGIAGLLTYLSLYLASFWYLWKYYRQDPEHHRLTSVLFSALLVSYFIQNLFVFDTLGTYILFYSVLGFISFLSVSQSRIRLNRPPSIQGINYYLASALVVVFAAVSFFTVWQPARANALVMKALYNSAIGRLNETVNAYQRVFNLRTYVTEEARQKFAEALLSFSADGQISQDAKLRAYRLGIEEMQQQLQASPNDARNYLYLMTLYNAIPSNEPGPKEEVIRLGEKALELSPSRPQLYFEMGQAAYALGRADEGLGYFEKALALNDFPVESHWNLALAYGLSDRFDDANHELDYVLHPDRANLISENSMRLMVKIFENKQQYGLTARLYEELLRRKPNDPTAVLDLAGAYAKACNIERTNAVLGELATVTDAQAKAVAGFRKEFASRCGK
ncbi:MAG: O-antigen ligase family protein, partial [Chloroflexi bacterium]|nr:O-antigen ligase family protein [Chloroflexota bacterium]